MSARPTGERFVFVDALRGVACIGVLLHHLLHNSVMEVTLRRILPLPVQMICDYGACGVQIFFVISGFVVAYSLRDFVRTPRYAGNFILRRQLRLDPTYWAVIIFVLVLAAVERSIPGLVRPQPPTVVQTAANMFYLQNILHVPQTISVAWTLCIEVQFYLVFICLLWIAYALAPRRPLAVVAPFLVVGVAVLSAWSKARTPLSPYFITFWYFFAGGVLCSWSLRGSTSHGACITVMIAFAVFAIFQHDSAVWFGLAATTTIYIVGRAGLLTVWAGGRVLQYLGRISYSLYLVHLPILQIVLRGAYKLTHENRWAALGWFIVAGFMSIGIAHLWNLAIEAPTMRFASRLKKFATTPPPSRIPIVESVPNEPSVVAVAQG